MKKFLAIASCALLSGVVALSACNREEAPPEGEIKGEYYEVTSEQLSEKLNTLDIKKLFGDPSEKDWSFDFALDCEMEIEANVKTTADDEDVTLLSGKLEEDSQLKVKLSHSEEQTTLGNIAVKAQNTNKIKGKIDKSEMLGIAEDLNINYTIAAYADDEFIYFSLPDMSELPFEVAPEGKYKASLDYVISSVTDLLPYALMAAYDAGADVEDVLQEYSLKAYVDDSDGLKVKICADKSSLYSILEKFADIPTETALQLATFNKFAIDLYFEADKNGAFEKAGFVADVDGTLDIDEGELSEDLPALSGPVKLKVDLSIKKQSVEIVLPVEEELAKYQDITQNDTPENPD